MRRAHSASQLASRPSPSEVARPMPVIQTSAADRPAEGFVSVMTAGLWKADPPGDLVHVSTQIRVREGDLPESEGRVAPQFAADPNLGLGDGEPGSFMNDAAL